jgi:hypothetical protein
VDGGDPDMGRGVARFRRGRRQRRRRWREARGVEVERQGGQRGWIIKTHDNSGEKFWEDFKNESVVSIGWDIKARQDLDNDDFWAAIVKGFGSSNHNKNKIYRFARDMLDGDIVAVMDGHKTGQNSDVRSSRSLRSRAGPTAMARRHGGAGRCPCRSSS